ncbi:MAG: hypothetical protein V9H69_22465 [Anaerolineae bacterium]
MKRRAAIWSMPRKTTANLKQASRLPRPQPLEKVLSWGATLAGGLHALHGKQFAHSQVNPQNILVSDKDARLTGFENVSVMPKNARDQALQLQRRDIAAAGHQPARICWVGRGRCCRPR